MSHTFTRTETRPPRRNRGGSWTPVFDYLLALLGIFLILAIVEKPKTTPLNIDTLGVYAVVITWPAGSDDDVDLWLQDPAGRLAWFSQQDAGLMHLAEDDLGTAASGTYDGVVTKENGERTIIKGAIPGEYTANIHLYQWATHTPIPVTCTLYRLRGDDKKIIEKHVLLVREGQEVTCFRFTLDAAGHVSGINTLPKRFVGANMYSG